MTRERASRAERLPDALPDGVHEGYARPVREVDVRRRVEHREVGPGADAERPTSSRRSAAAPPAVADHSASAGVMRMSRTASAMQNGIYDV